MPQTYTRFLPYDPAAGKRKKVAPISTTTWRKYEADIRWLHTFGLTQKQILDWLKSKGFYPKYVAGLDGHELASLIYAVPDNCGR